MDPIEKLKAQFGDFQNQIDTIKATAETEERARDYRTGRYTLEHRCDGCGKPMHRDDDKRFTDEEVYNWVPDYWREVIETIDGGKEWGLHQSNAALLNRRAAPAAISNSPCAAPTSNSLASAGS